MKYYEYYWTAMKPHCEITHAKKDAFTLLKGKKVLDVGCGDGEHYGKALAKECQLYGIDISNEAVSIARKNGMDATVGEADNLPFGDGEFDAVLFIDVLEHLFNPEGALHEANRVLKNNGFIIVSLPNAAYIRERLSFLFGDFNPRGSPHTSFDSPWADPHIRFFTKKTVMALLQKTGFKVRVFIGEAGIPILSHFFPSLFASDFLIIAEKQ
ncbi:MAG: class I SAM-dependent methyltransferase [Candidatus Micrarchaeia archaeon]